jgi:hypothetical protein
VKIPKCPMTLLITQITNVKIPKYPPKASFFFLFFYEDKSVILLYMEIEKTRNTLIQQPIFFYLRGKKIFLLLRVLWKAKKALGKLF